VVLALDMNCGCRKRQMRGVLRWLRMTRVDGRRAKRGNVGPDGLGSGAGLVQWENKCIQLGSFVGELVSSRGVR
jgi:hypothetical protein